MSQSYLNDPSQLEALLSSLSANDTAVIRKGEKELKPFLKKPESLAALLQQIRVSQNINVRHVAAILLKKRVNVLFGKLDPVQQNELKSALLTLLLNEPTKPVRTAIAGATAALTKSAFSYGTWPEIFEVLLQLANDPVDSNRDLCFNLLSQLAEHVPKQMKPHINTLAQLFVRGCQDPNTTVAASAMGATAAYIDALGDEPEVMQLQVVLTPMLAVMQACLDRDDDTVLLEGLEVIQESVSMEQPLINDHLSNLVAFVFHIIQKPDAEESIVSAAGQTLLNILEYRPKLVAKQKLVSPILSSLVQMIANSKTSAAGTLYAYGEMINNNYADKDEEDDEDDEDYNAEAEQQQLAQSCLDTMALNIPPKHFVQPALEICGQCMDSAQGNMRKAGCAVLGIIAEGCCDAIRTMLPAILPKLLQAMQDEDYFVRECACFALGQLSEHCQPEILYHNQMILPAVFSALDDPRPTVQGTSCYVLENFCEGLQPETLRPFLPVMVDKCGQLLQSPSKTTQEMALAALAATAVAVELDFLPYVEATCNVLSQIIFLTEPSSLGLRGRGLECLGHVAVAVGRDNFAPYVDIGMRSAMTGMQLDDDDGTLQEYGYIFIANCVKVMKDTFHVHLQTLVPHLLEVIAEAELSPVEDDEAAEDQEHGALDDADDEEEEGQDMQLNVMEGFVNTKKAAITAVGALAEHTGAAFLPHLPACLDSVLNDLSGCIHSFHKAIRGEAVSILTHLLSVAIAGHGTPKPAKGETVVMVPMVAEVCVATVSCCIAALEEDAERAVVAMACESLDGILEQLGLAALGTRDSNGNVLGERLMRAIYTLLTEKGKCQQHLARDCEDEDENAHDNLVIDGVTELIGVIARVSGASFIPYFEHLRVPLLRFTKPSRTFTDRSVAIGCFAEVMDEIGQPAAALYGEILLPLIQTGLTDEMEAVRRNCAYCLGALCQHSGDALIAHYGHFLQWLRPLCSRPAEQVSADMGGADVDNALSAVAKMIKVSQTAVPLPHVIPVMLDALPLRADMLECVNVYGCLMSLLEAGETTVLTHLTKILKIFAETLREGSKATDEAKVIISTGLKAMAGSGAHQAALMNAFQQVEEPWMKSVIEIAIQS